MHISKKYRHIYNKLNNFELQHDNLGDSLLSQDEIYSDLTRMERPRLFMDFYSEEGVHRALEEYGIFKTLKRRGFKDFIVVLDTTDPYLHKFRAYFNKKDVNNMLCEVYLRKRTFTATPTFNSSIAGEKFTFIVIEWLTLQDPTADFTPHRLPLPGQNHPGLKIGRKVLIIFINMCIRLRTDGLVNIPEHYHNAAFYSRYFTFFNPNTEGYFQAIRRDLGHMGIYNLAWAIDWGLLKEKKSGTYWKWFTDEQILPVSHKLESYFKSKEFRRQAEISSSSVQFTIDEELFRRKKAEHESKEINSPLLKTE